MQSHFFSVAVTLLLTSRGLNVLADPDDNLYYATLGQRTFAVNLFKAIARIDDDNFAVSTIDVFLGLLKVYFGSEGQGKLDLDYCLGITSADGYLSSSHEYEAMVDRVRNTQDRLLNFENGIAHRNTYTLKSDYKDTIRNVWKHNSPIAHFISIDLFLPDLEGWYDSHLGFITHFQQNEFTGAENIILFGGGYLFHQWQPEGSGKCVYKSTYTTDAKTFESDVEYTHMHGNFSYGELPDLSASYIAIPWSENPGDVILYLILPNAKDGLSKLQYGITHDTIEQIIDEAMEREIRVSVPETYISSRLHLGSILADKLYLYNVFDEGNLANMAVPDPEIVNSVVNVVNIRAFGAYHRHCPASEPPNDEMYSDLLHFNADHPFLIVIVSKGEQLQGKESLVLGIARHTRPHNTPKSAAA